MGTPGSALQRGNIQSFSQFKETAGTLFSNLKWSLKCYNNAAAPAMYVSCKYLYGQKIRLIRGDPPTHFHTGTPPSHTLTHKHTLLHMLTLSHMHSRLTYTHTPSHIYTRTHYTTSMFTHIAYMQYNISILYTTFIHTKCHLSHY